MVSSSSKKDKKKQVAEESLKTKRTREKLKRRFESIDLKITKEAIAQKTVEIHRWISRHAEGRIVLKDKTISLFDENKNAVEISQKISKIAEKLQTPGNYTEFEK